MKNKAQLQMVESMGVLLVFIIIIMFGYIFYGVVSQGYAEQAAYEKQELKAVKIAQLVSFLPELQCSSENIEIEPCVDLLKVISFNKLVCGGTSCDPISRNTDKINKYVDLFGYNEIYLDIVFPDGRVTNMGSGCDIRENEPYPPDPFNDCNDVPLFAIQNPPPYASYILYSNIPDNDASKHSKISIFLPTSVYNPKQKEFYFGVIVVNYFIK